MNLPDNMSVCALVRVDLWGASLAWIESISAGLHARGALHVESHVCPAYAGVTFQCDQEDVPALSTYAACCSRLALSSPAAKKALAYERTIR